MVIIFCCTELHWRPSAFHCRSSQIIGEAIFKEIILIKVNKHFYTSLNRVVQTVQSWDYREFTKETARYLGLDGWLGPSRWKGGRGIPGWRNRLDFQEMEMKKKKKDLLYLIIFLIWPKSCKMLNTFLSITYNLERCQHDQMDSFQIHTLETHGASRRQLCTVSF